MSKPKSKAGKSKKAVRKAAPKKRAASRRHVAPKAVAPAAAEQQQAPAAKAPPEYPWNVLVLKGGDKVPVTVTDEAHYQRLVEEFGAAQVEVQS